MYDLSFIRENSLSNKDQGFYSEEYSEKPLDEYLEQISSLLVFRHNKEFIFSSLTEREIEVLTLLAKGYDNLTIAKYLAITRITVQNHRARVREKLGINKQVDFVKFALAFDLIEF